MFMDIRRFIMVVALKHLVFGLFKLRNIKLKVKVLDKKAEGEAVCYLCKIDIGDYVESLPQAYKDFEVQRGIVSNKYLDRIAETISEKKHIPTIVLVSKDIETSGEYIEINDFDILDGLQRTHRFKVIYDSVSLIIREYDNSGCENISKFSRKFSSEIKNIDSSLKLMRMLDSYNVAKLKKPIDFFAGNEIWVEVWGGLKKHDQVKKMLLLNAGHKSVNIKHQLELLFLGTRLKLEELVDSSIRILREKQISSIQYSKNRTVGEYHFSHILSSLVALSAGGIVNTNSDFVSNLQAGEVVDVDLMDGFDIDLLTIFIKLLNKIDENLHSIYGDLGTKWIGREVVLVGFFGAIGAHSKESNIDINDLLNSVYKNVDTVARELKLEKFESARNNVKLNKVNVGNVNRKAVFLCTKDILKGGSTKSWIEYFGGGREV